MESPPVPAAVIEPEQDLNQAQNTPSHNILARTLPGKEPQAPHERASQLRPEDLIPKQHVERYDTFDSLPSTFGPRTNTGFSVATSTATDYTEPDQATLNDDDEGEGTPALRSFAFPSCPSDGLPSFPPTRMSSFAPDGHDTARGEGDDLPGPSNPISSRPGPSSERGQDPGPSPLPDEVEPSATDRLHIKVEMTREDSELTQTDHTLSQKEESEADTSATPNSERDVVENVCDQVLRDAFHLGLEELATTDAAAEAYEATRYFLDELSRIVPTNSAPVWAPSQSQMTRDPGGYGQSQGSSPSQGNGNGGGHGSRQNGGNKRRSSDDANDQNQDGYDDGYGSGGNGKRPRTDGQPHEDQYLSCPFRKRNPVKFNVRDFLSCATQSFPDVSQLKRHVKLFHKQKAVSGHACPRCKVPLGSKAAVDRHLAVPRDEVCESQTSPSSQDPEDGINAKTEDVLNGRRANTKVDTWDILWKTLFPNDEPSDIPHPEFIPPIELEEVQSDFHLASTVSSLRAVLASTQDLSADALLPLITRHIDHVFRSCRHQKTGSSHPPRRRRQQRPKSATVTSPTAPNPTDNLTLRPVPFPYDNGTPGGDSSPGSAISGGGGSWYSQQQKPQFSPMTSFHDMLAVGRLTTSSSNASAILSPAVGDDLSPAAFGGDSLSPSPAGFDGTPMFPPLNTPVSGGGYQFVGHRGGFNGGGGMGFNGGAGDRMVPFQIATSMPMHPHPLPSQQGLSDDMVPTTAIDRSGAYAFGGNMGCNGGY